MCSSETELPAQHRRTSLRQVSLWIFWGPKPRSPWWLQALPLPVLRDVTAVRTTHTRLQGNEWIQQFYFLHAEFIQMFKSFSLCSLEVFWHVFPGCWQTANMWCLQAWLRRKTLWKVKSHVSTTLLIVIFEIGNDRNTTRTVRAHSSTKTQDPDPHQQLMDSPGSIIPPGFIEISPWVLRQTTSSVWLPFLFISSTSADKHTKNMWMKCFISSDECSHFSFHFRCAPGYQGNPLQPNGKCVPNRKYQDFWSSSNMDTSSHVLYTQWGFIVSPGTVVWCRMWSWLRYAEKCWNTPRCTFH